ncbi:mitogen-activated protein kinase kinase kinase 7 [Actinidia rufa]|uniref:Mitogen-activated protein kinase kinase kinase 7 n=1 Tax=Actinidia rufa TaxID=165716 RepID=A0A7J0GY03_9ERIC|nr:mitogen-activated protein kinase kinase kinase 7 [Actinidia rufa]
MLHLTFSSMFQDARQRPDAKTLLSHPWIQNSRRVLQSSLRNSGTIRNVEEDGALEADISNGDDQSTGESPSAEHIKVSGKELLSDIGNSSKDNGLRGNYVEERADNAVDEVLSDQVLTLAIHEKPPLQYTSFRLLADNDAAPSHREELHGPPQNGEEGEVLMKGNMGFIDSRRKNITAGNLEGNGTSIRVDHKSFGFGTKNQAYSPRKAANTSVSSGGNELSRFSDTPGDASLDDLFHPLEKSLEDRAAEASTSASSLHVNQDNAFVADAGKNDLATKLRATIAQKQLETDTGKTNGGDLLRLMKFILKEDVIDIDGLGFADKLPAENLFPVQWFGETGVLPWTDMESIWWFGLCIVALEGDGGVDSGCWVLAVILVGSGLGMGILLLEEIVVLVVGVP